GAWARISARGTKSGTTSWEVSFAMVVCSTMGATTLPARRPSAGAVPGRWGACLAVRTSPAALLLLPSSPVHADAGAPGGSRQRDHFGEGAGAQRLQRLQRSAFAQELHVAVGEGEIGAARMAAAEGIHAILDCGKIAVGRHAVVDPYRGGERDISDSPLVRDEPPLAHSSYSWGTW